jgi:2-oxoglutarate ferredoxin oxidoreductase subunit beta
MGENIELNSKQIREKYMLNNRLPTIFCPGCGLGILMNILARAIEAANLDKDKVVLVSGIGCTARIPNYFDFASVHTTHGRAIPVATAIKLTNPSLTVIVISGDGDLVGIGGNHLLHAFRRNVNLNIICANNFIYGMTGGQNSPTTHPSVFSTSFPWAGNPEDSLDVSKLAMVGGATYVARWTVFHPRQAIRSITNGLKKKGLSFIEMLSPCPTNYGRRNNAPTPVEMKKLFEEMTELLDKSTKERNLSNWFISTENEKILLGMLQDLERTPFEEKWKETCAQAKKLYLASKTEKTQGGPK